MNWLLVIVGAAVGAPLRYLTDRIVQSKHDTLFPWGTFAANLTGCLSLGILTGAVTAGAASSHIQLLVGTGFCGALSTYSTFSYETLRLAQTGARFYAAANIIASVIAGLGATFTGTALAQAIWT
ncbi:fluoride efflux transporter CrcB [Nocardia sp. CA-107356]|uniref:fluoride efflux transporter CrcB n=1 Tax=Nocardia sp. CA-107356 TaxID=3239972 RepID=UPI003D9314EA